MGYRSVTAVNPGFSGVNPPEPLKIPSHLSNPATLARLEAVATAKRGLFKPHEG